MNINLKPKHITDTQFNNRLRYDFKNELNFENGGHITLTKLELKYSWFNIDGPQYYNDTFTYYFWTTNGVLYPFEIKIEPGYYDIEAIYEYLIKEMYKRGHYLESTNVSETGQYYPVELRVNTSYYAFEIVFISISMDLVDSGSWKMPTTWRPPTQYQTMAFNFSVNNSEFYKLLGFDQTLVKPDENDISQSTTKEYVLKSTVTPQLEPSSIFKLHCNMISNKYAETPNEMLTFMLDNSVTIGQNYTPNLLLLSNEVPKGIYRYLEIELFDEYNRKLKIRDPKMLFSFSIKPNEM